MPGGRPFRCEFTLSLEDGAALVAAAAVAELADGAYAAEVIHQHLAQRAALVPADWQQVMGELIGHRAELAGLRADVHAVGRLINQIAAHANTTQATPAAVVLARMDARLAVVAGRVAQHLAELDEMTAKARERGTRP